MAVAFGSVSSSTVVPFATSIDIAVPAGTVNGDLLLMSASNSAPAAFTAPAGWTVLDANANIASLSAGSVASWYRVANSEPASYTISAGTGAQPITATMVRYTGVDTTAPIVAHGLAVSTTTSATSPASPTLAGVAAGVMVVNHYWWDSGTATNYSVLATVPASPWATRLNTGTPSGGYNIDVGIADQVNPTTHPTATASDPSGLWGVESVALKPAAVAPALPPGQFFPFV